MQEGVDVWRRIHERLRDGLGAPVVAADAPRPARRPREHHRRRITARSVRGRAGRAAVGWALRAPRPRGAGWTGSEAWAGSRSRGRARSRRPGGGRGGAWGGAQGRQRVRLWELQRPGGPAPPRPSRCRQRPATRGGAQHPRRGAGCRPRRRRRQANAAPSPAQLALAIGRGELRCPHGVPRSRLCHSGDQRVRPRAGPPPRSRRRPGWASNPPPSVACGAATELLP